MYRNKQVIVYGLGEEFEKQRMFLESYFTVVGCSDRDKKQIDGYLKPSEINGKVYDYIYVTSWIFYEEIQKTLSEQYGIEKSRIITTTDVFGIPFDIEKIRDCWVIEKLSQIESGKTILDAGAGEMKYADDCRHLKYIAQDFGKYDPQEDSRGLQMEKWDTSRCSILCDIVDMPLENGAVDAVMCTEVFEHIKNPMLALKEFSRILKPGGELLLTAPVCSLTHMAPYYYYNGFSLYWYRDHLHENGFEIVEIKKYGNYFRYLCQEMLRVSAVSDRYCNYQLKMEERTEIYKSVALLTQMERMDAGSEELLCFGHMVLARKI